MAKNKTLWLVTLFGLLLVIYSVFSYSFTDPNLVLSSWPPYWQFQMWMWQHIFTNKTLLVGTYFFLVVGLMICYTHLLKQLSTLPDQSVKKEHFIAYALIIGCVLFSYNALSHDVFNYIFNAKMVLVYQQDPHIFTALQFPDDEWTRFMHNTHTPAPYGYGWTALSLVPAVLGSNVFVVTWLLFRLFEVVAIGLMYFSLQGLAKLLFNKSLTVAGLALLFLNPLFLIEVVGNMHNDLWMIVPAIWAVTVTVKYSHSLVKAVFLAGILLLLSISIKFATVLLVPLLLLVLTQRTLLEKFLSSHLKRMPFSGKFAQWITSFVENKVSQFLPVICSIVLFIPLLMPRSQYFHPWYLLWSLAWIPVIKQVWWRCILLVFSVSSLLRYIPWMYVDGFEKNTLLWQQLITWGIPILCLIAWLIKQKQITQKNTLNPV